MAPKRGSKLPPRHRQNYRSLAIAMFTLAAKDLQTGVEGVRLTPETWRPATKMEVSYAVSAGEFLFGPSTVFHQWARYTPDSLKRWVPREWRKWYEREAA